MTDTSALFGLGVVCVFLGLWLIWPALAIGFAGVLLASTAIGLALLKRREAKP